MQEQVGKLIHGQINLLYHRPVLELVEQLLQVVPGHLNSFFLANSGAEAVEASIKLARQATGRMVTPEEVAGAIAYLASPRSGSTTGTALEVDGGVTHLRPRAAGARA